VGEGALRFAQKEQRSKQSCPALTVSPDTMISKRASSEHAYWFEKYLKGDTTIPDNRTVAITQDTVGAVACTVDGQFGAGVSR
jgi:isoaspartyl peptidase/L-asparaginase-like protein (Ntn-hydrolase superfamily)